MGCIYRATCQPNGKKYYGLTTKTLAERMQRHWYVYRRVDTPFYRAIRKYGWDSFSWSILYESNDLDELQFIERGLIDITNNQSPRGYNAAGGGEGMFNPTEEILRKMHSPEARLKRSVSLTGKQRSDDVRKRISEASKGKHISDKTREKLREINLGRKMSEEIRTKMSTSQKTRRDEERAMADPIEIVDTSAYPGVSFCRSKNRYRVYLQNNGKREYVGSFKTVEEASIARNAKILELRDQTDPLTRRRRR